MSTTYALDDVYIRLRGRANTPDAIFTPTNGAIAFVRHHDVAVTLCRTRLCWVLLDAGRRPTTSRRQLCSIDDWTSQHLPLHAAAVARHMGPNERTTSATKLNELRATCYELRRDVRSACGINDLCYPLGVASHPTCSALNLHDRLNSICFVTCQFVNFHLLSVTLRITRTLSNDAFIVK